jgi:hypothetical protein
MRQVVAGFICIWMLWSAPAADSATGGRARSWVVAARLGSGEECAAHKARRVNAASDGTASVEYVGLPEGERPAAR